MGASCPQTDKFKNRTDFISTAIKELIEVTRAQNSLNPSGRVIFRDSLVKKRIETFNELEKIHGTCDVYYSSGADITPKREIHASGTKGNPIPTPPAKPVKTKELKIEKKK